MNVDIFSWGSSAMSGYFTPVKHYDLLMIDGGTMHPIDLLSAINF